MDVSIDQIRQEIEQALEGMTPEQFDYAPAGKWSAAQILEHLARTYGTTAKLMEICVTEGAVRNLRSATLRERLMQVVVVRFGHMPQGRKAPEMMVPRGDTGEVALQNVRTNLARFEIAVAAAEERFGRQSPVGMHMILGPLTGAEWRKFHLVHTRHHAAQLRERKKGVQSRSVAA